MTYSKPKNVAIIGAGTSGLTLAILLHQVGINSSIFELQRPGIHPASALNLAPNGLSVFKRAGVVEKLFEDGASQKAFHSYDFEGNEVGQYCVGGKEHFRFDGCVPYRDVLLQALEDKVKQCGVQVHWGRKFSHIVSDTGASVTFAFTDGSQETADMLVGSDGIWSKIRGALNPGKAPVFSGQLAIHQEVKLGKLRVPKDLQFPAQWSGKLHSMALIPSKLADGSSIFFRQMDYPDLGRQGWADLHADQQKLYGLFTAQKEQYPDMLQSALETIEPGKLDIWAFHALPRLDHWSSETGRVVILGDAAHAMPPSGGQGANQAAEDAYTLAQVLSRKSNTQLKQRLDLWQSYREERLDKIIDLTASMTASRRTLAEGETYKAPEVADPESMQWLHGIDLDEDLKKVYKSLS